MTEPSRAVFISYASQDAEAATRICTALRAAGIAIHIYGGDFFNTPRSQWDPESLVERPSNGETIKAMFEQANQRLARESCG